jgi:ligand-binding sensor domain-containing protein/two-component sensor histidine kinase
MITKRTIQTLLLIVGLITVCTSYAQEYNFIQYDVKDGLAGSTVYDLCQDKDGFIWFATEAGISRFDGTQFKNFTTSDGLPETEILKLFADSKGRIWMAPFKNNVCYYYNGQIHNQTNDSVLKRINLTSVISIFHESSDQDIGFYAGNTLTVVSANNTINQYTSHEGSRIFVRRNPQGKGFQLNVDDSCYVVTKGKMLHVSCASLGNMKVTPKIDKVKATLKVTAEDYDPGMNHVLFTNTWSGSYMVDTITFDHFEEPFLKGKQVSHALVDSEKNIWFATLGEGVYKLASREFRTHYFFKNQSQEIFSLTKINNKIHAGSAFGRIYQLREATIFDTINANKEFNTSLYYGSTNRVTCLQQLKDGSLLMGSDGLLVKKTSKGNILNTRIYAVKSIEELPNGMVLVGTARRALVIHPNDLAIQDTIFPSRTTCVCFYNNNYYIGTVNGLYVVNANKQVRYLGEAIPSFRQRISYFCKSPNGLLYIATYGAGIICLKNDQVVNQITTEEGISSNICRTIFVNNDFLWAGTDKGLNKINISQTPYPVTTYSTSDGLPTNVINAVYVDGNTIYVGSPAGVTWFNETQTGHYSKCNLRILDISVGNKPQPLKNNYRLGYQENSLKITYAGISFKSGGNIWYRYRLKGLTNTWDSTAQNVLEYPSLPPGNYEFELIAINKKGIVSDPVTLAFIVDAPFWQTWPFQILIIVTVILITWLLVAWRFSFLRKKEQERTAVQQKLNELEQMALRAQMNPHFIFNCLNSIQNFIITNDLESTNLYLSEFAHLIRQTLDNSEKSTISIAKEIKYLRRYLEMEMMRFGHSFNYNIEVDPQLDPDMEHIPTMILQPYIENSIRHGIRYKENGGGYLDIKFLKSREGFICIIEDNGIGRKKANEYKSQMHVEYQSKGMSLTAERINILNRQLSEPITIDINDLTDAHNQAIGTRITLWFPYTLTFKPVKK